nr:hypothetical protein [uncultured Methanospirillum sp.]
MIERDRAGEVLSTLEYLFDPGQIIEIRALSSGAISSGYFSDYQKAVAEILIREADTLISGFYVTLNEVNPALLARRANRIQSRMGKADASTADSDIIRRRWLPIDIDPVRPSGVSSSDDEHAAALTRADTIRGFLATCGWPDPLLADSGNGAHLLYPIDLQNNEESKGLVRQVLEILDVRFSTAGCKVDTANFNAARIWKVYGTISRKGDNLPDRPHRRSKVLSMPPKERVLSADDLVQLINQYPAQALEPGLRPTTKPGMNPEAKGQTLEEMASVREPALDLAQWLNRFNLTYLSKPYQGGTLFVLDSCPFSDDHTDGAFAIQFPNGAIFAGCHHDSCGGGRQRWPELRARFDPPRRDPEEWFAEARRARTRAKLIAEGRIDPDEEMSESSPDTGTTPAESDPVHQKADEILKSGDPLSFLLDAFSEYHEGDRAVAECLIHSLVSRSVINSKGLHVSISGESGKGKSHAIDTMRTLIPPGSRIEGRVSDKALFYMEDLLPGTVITLDDVSLSDQMQEILKGVTTSFQKPFPYRTVNKDRKPQICTIPQRCVWWIAKVEGSGDDQVINRMLTCWIDDTEEQDQKVLDRALAGAEEMPDNPAGISETVSVCRALWEDLSSVWVVIPFARRIRFQSAENRRNPDMLLDLIRTNAALYQQQRERHVVNGVTSVLATEEDFDQASRLFVELNGETGAQGNKLTKRESLLTHVLATSGVAEISVSQIQTITGWTCSTICKLLHGYQSYGKVYSGLLAKCPAVSFLDRTVTKGDQGQTTMRHTRVYLWDPFLYDAWLKGGSVWLAGDGTDPDQSDPDDSSDQPPGDHGRSEATVAAKVPGALSKQQSSLERSIPDSNAPAQGCSIRSLKSRDFAHIEGFPEKVPCSVCERGPTQYRTRPDRVHGSDAEPVRMLCLSCYERLVSHEIAAIVPLPGMIHPEDMVPLHASVGRCDLCQTNEAAWSDPTSRIHLCESCYQREKARSAGDHSSSIRGVDNLPSSDSSGEESARGKVN